MCENIFADVVFEEIQEGLQLQWKAIRSAQQYIIHYERRRTEENSSIKSAENKHTFTHDIYDFKCGDTVTISIEAVLKDGKTNVICKDSSYVIGKFNTQFLCCSRLSGFNISQLLGAGQNQTITVYMSKKIP